MLVLNHPNPYEEWVIEKKTTRGRISFIFSYIFKEKLLKFGDSEKLSWLLSAEGEGRLIKGLFWKVDHEAKYWI